MILFVVDDDDAKRADVNERIEVRGAFLFDRFGMFALRDVEEAFEQAAGGLRSLSDARS